MSLLDDLRKHLSSDLLQQVTDALGDDFNFDLVPRTRLNKVIKQRDSLKEMIEGSSSGTQQKSGSQSNPEDDFKMPDGKGQKKSPTVEELRQQLETEKNNEINGLKIRYAGLDALRNAGAIDPEVAFSLLDKSKLSLDDTGAVTGLQEQIAAQQESKKYLYPSSNGGRNNTPGGTGKEGGSEKFAGVKSRDDFLKLSLEDQIKFKNAHPEIFKQYLNN